MSRRCARAGVQQAKQAELGNQEKTPRGLHGLFAPDMRLQKPSKSVDVLVGGGGEVRYRNPAEL